MHIVIQISLKHIFIKSFSRNSPIGKENKNDFRHVVAWPYLTRKSFLVNGTRQTRIEGTNDTDRFNGIVLIADGGIYQCLLHSPGLTLPIPG